MQHTKDDPALRTTAVRDAITEDVRRASAVDGACTRRAVTVAEAVSWEALSEQYPQVRRLRDAAASVATDLELRAEAIAPLHASTARMLWQLAERLRAGVQA